MLLGLAACEPASVTDARNQLARGPADTVRYLLPLATDTLDRSDLDIQGDTVIGGLQGVAFDPESVSVAVADDLRFQNVTVTDVAVSFDPAVLAAAPPGTLVDSTAQFPGLATEPRVQSIDQVDVLTGTLTLTTSNRLVEVVSYTVTLGGFLDPTGSPFTASSVLPAAPGDGSYATDVLVFDLANGTLLPNSAVLDLRVTATLSGSPLNAANADDAILQVGIADFDVQAVSGSLDPQVTAELTDSVEDFTEVTLGSVDFGKFEDAVIASTLNAATGTLRFRNTADAPVELVNFTLGAVQLTPTGQVPRDPATGIPLYETDGAGTPILVPVTDPGQSTLTVPRTSTNTITVAMPQLADRVVHLLLGGSRVAVVGSGAASAGDGQPSRITRTDSVYLVTDLFVGFDFTVPDSGVVITENSLQDGLDFAQNDIDDIVLNLLVHAGVTAEVTNSTPFALDIDLAYAPGDLGNADVFLDPNAVVVSPIQVAAPTLDAAGRVTTPVVDTVEIILVGRDIEPLLGIEFTATLRTRVRPGLGGNGRAALGAGDEAIFNSSVVIDVKRGGGQ
jgi:hypothetical protein